MKEQDGPDPGPQAGAERVSLSGWSVLLHPASDPPWWTLLVEASTQADRVSTAVRSSSGPGRDRTTARHRVTTVSRPSPPAPRSSWAELASGPRVHVTLAYDETGPTVSAEPPEPAVPGTSPALAGPRGTEWGTVLLVDGAPTTVRPGEGPAPGGPGPPVRGTDRPTWSLTGTLTWPTAAGRAGPVRVRITAYGTAGPVLDWVTSPVEPLLRERTRWLGVGSARPR